MKPCQEEVVERAEHLGGMPAPEAKNLAVENPEEGQQGNLKLELSESLFEQHEVGSGEGMLIERPHSGDPEAPDEVPPREPQQRVAVHRLEERPDPPSAKVRSEERTDCGAVDVVQREAPHDPVEGP